MAGSRSSPKVLIIMSWRFYPWKSATITTAPLRFSSFSERQVFHPGRLRGRYEMESWKEKGSTSLVHPMTQLVSKEDGTVFFNNCSLSVLNRLSFVESWGKISSSQSRSWDGRHQTQGLNMFEHWQQRRIPVERQNLGLHLEFFCLLFT